MSRGLTPRPTNGPSMHWFHHPHIEVLGRYPDGLLIQSDETVDSSDKVVADVEGQEVHMTLRHVRQLEIAVRPWHDAVEALRQRTHHGTRKFLYRAELHKPKEFLPFLRVLLEPAPSEDLEERDQPRFGHHLKLRCPELPGYEALVYDVSLSGVRLDLHNSVAVGKVLSVELDLDHESAAPLKLDLEIRWVRPVGHHYEAGARFLNLSAANRHALDRFLEYLKQH